MEKLQNDSWFEEVQDEMNTKELIEETVNTLYEKTEKLKENSVRRRNPSRKIESLVFNRARNRKKESKSPWKEISEGERGDKRTI